MHDPFFRDVKFYFFKAKLQVIFSLANGKVLVNVKSSKKVRLLFIWV